MPRLHKYTSGNAHYVLTSINGSVITYQLTAQGERRLADAGVMAGQNFERAMLLDLYRSGDAYAPGVEFPEAVRANQLEIDFAAGPSLESAFPMCDGCGGLIDLHLTLMDSTPPITARLHCSVCRSNPSNRADTSVPLSILSRALLTRLLADKRVEHTSENVVRYRSLLNAELAVHWDAVRKHRASTQQQFFGDGDLGGLGLG